MHIIVSKYMIWIDFVLPDCVFNASPPASAALCVQKCYLLAKNIDHFVFAGYVTSTPHIVLACDLLNADENRNDAGFPHSLSRMPL